MCPNNCLAVPVQGSRLMEVIAFFFFFFCRFNFPTKLFDQENAINFQSHTQIHLHQHLLETFIILSLQD